MRQQYTAQRTSITDIQRRAKEMTRWHTSGSKEEFGMGNGMGVLSVDG